MVDTCTDSSVTRSKLKRLGNGAARAEGSNAISYTQPQFSPKTQPHHTRIAQTNPRRLEGVHPGTLRTSQHAQSRCVMRLRTVETIRGSSLPRRPSLPQTSAIHSTTTTTTTPTPNNTTHLIFQSQSPRLSKMPPKQADKKPAVAGKTPAASKTTEKKVRFPES